METSLPFIGAIILVALAFDFINGFHDAANSIATIVSTRVLPPLWAVVWAAFFNFSAAFLFGTAVARTVGSGMVHLEFVTPWVILAGLIGAIVWDLITWWFGLPTSSSHALLGGYAGAAMAHVAHLKGLEHAFDAIIASGWRLTLIFIVIAPLIGMLLAMFLMVDVYWLFRNFNPTRMDKYFRRLQLVSSALLSISHGTNDAQKTMGIITAVLVSAKFIPTFDVPLWVIMSSYTVIALGTLSGGWRIIHTMGARLTKLKPRSGFCAETAAAITIIYSAHFMHPAPPVSTTHVTAGAIAGVGSIQRIKAVRWGIATNIVWAWILTIPAAALVGWISLEIIHLFVPKL
jgi:inorganic phosphate transporter, PiT family